MRVKEARERLAGRRPRFGDRDDFLALELLTLYQKCVLRARKFRAGGPIPAGHLEYLETAKCDELAALLGLADSALFAKIEADARPPQPMMLCTCGTSDGCVLHGRKRPDAELFALDACELGGAA